MNAVSLSNDRLLETPSIGGWTTFSTVDWPGQLVAVVFVAGCPWRCHYCHNPHLQQRQASVSWEQILEFLDKRRGLLDGVVFSGGEPLSERRLPEMIEAVQAMGYKIGLHTAGIYPRQLQTILPGLDWVGLDIKTNAAGYPALTGRQLSIAPVTRCLKMLLDSGCKFECRTTWSPQWLSESALLDLAQELADLGVQNYVVQAYRADPKQVPTLELGTAARQKLASLFPTFVLR